MMDRHEFVPEYSAESPYCGALVMRDGFADVCAEHRDAEVHQSDTKES